MTRRQLFAAVAGAIAAAGAAVIAKVLPKKKPAWMPKTATEAHIVATYDAYSYMAYPSCTGDSDCPVCREYDLLVMDKIVPKRGELTSKGINAQLHDNAACGADCPYCP